MTDGRGRRLPPEIEAVIEDVMSTAHLELVHGREEVREELRAHFEDGLAAGHSVGEMLERFGDPEVAGRRIARTRPRAAARTHGLERGPQRWAVDIGREARRAVRRLLATPGFTAIVVATLALGVGANTAVFTVLNAVLLEDLPYAEPDRLVRLYEGRAEEPTSRDFLRGPVFVEYRSWDEVFQSIATVYTYREVGADLTDGDMPIRVNLLRVSAGYFETLGVLPLRGRTFVEEESFGVGEAGSSSTPITRVAVIGERLWRQHLGERADIVGHTIQLDGFSYEVVGVVASSFRNPIGTRSDVWIPQDLRAGGSNNYDNFYLSAVARLRPGVGLDAARERLAVLSRNYAESQPDVENSIPRIFPLHADIVGSTRGTMLWILTAAAGLVLLMACVNIASLLFARGLSRDRHLALQAALGSGRLRLVTGLLAENVVLAFAGGLLGVVVGGAGLRLLLLLAPDALPLVADVQVGTTAFGFAMVSTALALAIFGLAPAVRMSRTAPADVLRSGDRTSTMGKSVRRVRDGLVIVQIATALVLVAGATLLTRSFAELAAVPLAVEPAGVLTYEVNLPASRYGDGSARHAFHEELHDRVRALPGVTAVGATSWLPVNGRYHTWGFYWDPEAMDAFSREGWHGTDVRIIAGDYFESLGIDVVRGARPADVDYGAEPVLWINESIRDEVFASVDPLDVQVYVGGAVRRVVGIVEDVPHNTRGEVSPKLYMPHAQYNDDRNWALVQSVRSRGDLAGLREAIRGQIGAMDPQLVMHEPASFSSVLGRVRAQDRFATVLMGTFAGLAILLSFVGTYGVLAGSVAGRTREFGIRMALGADGPRIRSMVLRYACALTVPGVVLGLVVARAGTPLIETLLFEVKAGDPLTYLAGVTVFATLGMVSAWIPARRATRVDTAQTLAGP